MLINSINSANEAAAAPVLKALGCKNEWSRPSWPLPNLRDSSEISFWGWRSSYSFKTEIWADQIQIDGRWANLLIYFVGYSQFIGGGFAVAVFRQYQKEEVRYYEWRACDHEFSEKNVGHCLHRYTCEKCGEAYEVDSSG